VSPSDGGRLEYKSRSPLEFVFISRLLETAKGEQFGLSVASGIREIRNRSLGKDHDTQTLAENAGED
jgi:hypothetical protein